MSDQRSEGRSLTVDGIETITERDVAGVVHEYVAGLGRATQVREQVHRRAQGTLIGHLDEASRDQRLESRIEVRNRGADVFIPVRSDAGQSLHHRVPQCLLGRSQLQRSIRQVALTDDPLDHGEVELTRGLDASASTDLGDCLMPGQSRLQVLMRVGCDDLDLRIAEQVLGVRSSAGKDRRLALAIGQSIDVDRSHQRVRSEHAVGEGESIVGHD